MQWQLVHLLWWCHVRIRHKDFCKCVGHMSAQLVLHSFALFYGIRSCTSKKWSSNDQSSSFNECRIYSNYQLELVIGNEVLKVIKNPLWKVSCFECGKKTIQPLSTILYFEGKKRKPNPCGKSSIQTLSKYCILKLEKMR